ncbi:PucR family transcriptional regulator [Jatrophihabitans fulvus]
MTLPGSAAPAGWPPDGARRASHRGVPRALAQFMRPVEDDLVSEIVDEVQRRIAEYGPDPDGVNLTSTRLVVDQAVRYFVEHIEQPDAPRDQLNETLRRLGRSMAYEGRRVEVLHSAYQIGAQLAWKRIRAMAERRGLGATLLGELGEELYAYMATLAEQSEIGFREAQSQLSDAAHQWRGRALELVLAGQAAPTGELAAHAAAGGWQVPEQVALVAVRPSRDLPLPSVRMLHPSTLATMRADDPVVLLPAPVAPELGRELAVLFEGHRIAIGCEVPLASAAASLRWARRALELVDAGVIPAAPVVDCRDHVGTLWIHAEPMLAEIVVSSTLAPLFAEPRNSRRILGLTLLHWLAAQNPSAPAMAEALGVHPQTVRYRLKRLREIFGDRVDDPQVRLEMSLALRATGPQWNDGRPAPA